MATGLNLEDELIALEELKIKSLELTTARLRQETEKLKETALDISQQRIESQWNMQRTEFVMFYEDLQIQKIRGIFHKIREQVSASEEAEASLMTELYDLRKEKASLKVQNTQVKDKIDSLLKATADANNKVQQLERDIQIFTKRNAAIRLKLNKQKEEIDDEIDKYSGMLETVSHNRKRSL